MKLIIFLFVLVLSGIVFRLIHTLLLAAVFGVASFIIKISRSARQEVTLNRILLLPAGLFVQGLCVLLWVSVVVVNTKSVTGSPDVDFPLVYWTIAFVAVPWHIQTDMFKERHRDIRVEGRPNQKKEFLTTVWTVVAIICFLVFAYLIP